MFADAVLGDPREVRSVERSLNDQVDIIQQQRAGDGDRERFVVFVELPFVDGLAAVPEADAAMVQHVPWRQRLRVCFEVLRSTDHRGQTFPESDRVDHRKVTFYNRLGITLVADLYVPKNIDRSRRHAALVVGGPYGAVKEQASGLYAQTMAERGFITFVHDPSYVGESGGQPHGIASSEPLVEDFSAAVDFLGGLPFVDRDRIGVVGVCGSARWTGFP